MKRIALKIDVDTCRGTLAGVPALIETLQRHEASGTFFFSFGPDHSGRDARATSLRHYYNLATRLYGRLLPGPKIARRAAAAMRQAQEAGFEVGVHAWDRTIWEKRARQADNAWIEGELGRACDSFSAVFSERPLAHAAAGWQMNRHALRLTQRLGFSYSSDCRGDSPFIPVIDGEIVDCPQLPTTLPTLDELFALDTCSEEQAVERILRLSGAIAGDHVFTLRAELEGLRFAGAFERLVAGWKSRDYALVALRDLRATLVAGELPRHNVGFAEIPGRNGARMTQGTAFLHEHAQ